MKNKTLLMIFLIVFVLGSAASFLIVEELNSLFWTGYISVVVAWVVVMLGCLLTGKDLNQPASYLFITASVGYIVALLVLIYLTIGTIKLPVFIGLELILLMIYLVIIVVGLKSYRYIKKQDNDVSYHRGNLNDLITEVESTCNSDLSEILEALKYSDPIIHENVYEEFDEMANFVHKVCENPSSDNIKACLNHIKYLNKINKQAKR